MSSTDCLKNKQWLETEYCIKQLTAKQIAKNIGCSARSVFNWMNTHGLPIRSTGEARMINRDDDGFHVDQTNYGVFVGSLLGDASIHLQNGRKHASFRKENTHYEHVLYVAQNLFSFRPERRIRECYRPDRDLKTYRIESLAHPFLTDLYHGWYYRKGKRNIKQVPKNIEITPKTLLHLFLDDGSSTYTGRKRKESPEYCYVQLATQSFTLEENRFLCAKISKLGIYAYVVRAPNGTGYRIKIPQNAASKFFDVIGPCPVELQNVMGYKWKYARLFSPRLANLRDSRWLYEMYVTREMTPNEIGKLLGCNPGTILKWLHKHKISVKHPRQSACIFPSLRDKDFMLNLAVEQQLTVSQMTGIIGCHKSNVLRWLHRHEIEFKNPNARHIL